MFVNYPSYFRYRTLFLTAPLQSGEDVYALQHAINAVCGSSLAADGVLGQKTSGGIHTLQQRLGITVDGKAGGVTQRAAALSMANGLAGNTTEAKIAKGQIEHESSFRLGNYSSLRSNSTYDAGVCQMNTEHTPPKDGFDPFYAIQHLHSNLLRYYGLYHDATKFRGKDQSPRRRWSLAAGSWNAPAFTNWLAGVQPWQTPGADDLDLIEAYMVSVTAYL